MSKFIEDYKRLRKQGYNELESFGAVSGAIAVSGTFEDLDELHTYYLKDFLHETEKIFNESEEVKNENNKIA